MKCIIDSIKNTQAQNQVDAGAVLTVIDKIYKEGGCSLSKLESHLKANKKLVDMSNSVGIEMTSV